MGRDCTVTLTWADGDYTFRLPLGQLEELQEKCDAGPPFVEYRLGNKIWRTADVRETIRLGLIGGGMKPSEALKLTRRYVDNGPWMENALVAHVIISAALVGVPDEEPGKAEAAQASGDEPANSPTGSSPTPQSTQPAQ